MLVTEFVVEVYQNRIEWNGLDGFLRWLILRKPAGGLLPYARVLNSLARSRRSAPAR